MTQGYITLAAKSTDNIQLQQAVLLASSIKKFDKEREFTLLVDSFSSVPKKYEDAFDTIIELPYGVFDPTEDVMLNAWQVYGSSPYEQTMFIDKRSIFLNNIDDMWDNLAGNYLTLPKQASNFKGEPNNGKYRFMVHERNDIPQYWDSVMYFEKSECTEQFFKMFDVVLKEFRRIYLKLIEENRPGYFDYNLLVNITLKMLGEQDNIHGDIPFTMLSLDNITTDDDDLPADWCDYLNNWYSNGMLKINNHRQSGIVCYNSDNFLDDDILDDHRRYIREDRIEI